MAEQNDKPHDIDRTHFLNDMNVSRVLDNFNEAQKHNRDPQRVMLSIYYLLQLLAVNLNNINTATFQECSQQPA